VVRDRAPDLRVEQVGHRCLDRGERASQVVGDGGEERTPHALSPPVDLGRGRRRQEAIAFEHERELIAERPQDPALRGVQGGPVTAEDDQPEVAVPDPQRKALGRLGRRRRIPRGPCPLLIATTTSGARPWGCVSSATYSAPASNRTAPGASKGRSRRSQLGPSNTRSEESPCKARSSASRASAASARSRALATINVISREIPGRRTARRRSPTRGSRTSRREGGRRSCRR